jgi:hypothetical protein
MADYASGSYEEIVISGHKIEAKNPAIKQVVNGKEVAKRTIDRTNIPKNLEISSI